MTGTGTHLKQIIKGFLGVKTEGCGGCEDLLKRMDEHEPAWSRRHINEIVPVVQKNAKKNKSWKARILARIPGIRLPIHGIILLAIARAEQDLEEEASKAPERKA